MNPEILKELPNRIDNYNKDEDLRITVVKMKRVILHSFIDMEAGGIIVRGIEDFDINLSLPDLDSSDTRLKKSSLK